MTEYTDDKNKNDISFFVSEDKCGYFFERDSRIVVTSFKIAQEQIPFISETSIYGYFIKNGFRRNNNYLYISECPNCSECIPIRINTYDFTPSKSQRAVFKKNQDIEITILSNFEDFVTEEKAFLLREYDNYHNHTKKDYKKMTINEAKTQLYEMNSGYKSVTNIEYRLKGKLIGVSIIDIITDFHEKTEGISSNYFYYDVSPDILKRSIGVYSILYEIEYYKSKNIPYYYLGLYLPHCSKMKYKIDYKPYELFLFDEWLKVNHIEEDKNKKDQLDEKNIYQFPKAGTLYKNFRNISFVTDNISLQLLYSAYMQGCFPWFDEDLGHPVLWQNPSPRFIISISEMHVSKSIQKFLKHTPYKYTMDKAFADVIKNCATQKRKDQDGTWIGPKIIDSYILLHKAGFAHSFEVWHDDKLVGGFYGVLIGSIFCGESMFTIESNSSKSAFVLFTRAFENSGGKIIDCQSYTENMARYGAKTISRLKYLDIQQQLVKIPLSKDLKSQFEEIVGNL